MKPTEEQVEELARAMHAAYATMPYTGPMSWDDLTSWHRGFHRHAARALLETPPPVLLDALGACVPDAVAGRAAP